MRSGTARSASRAPKAKSRSTGATYLPRKFKIGFAVPPSNDIDVYTQDLGFIAIAGENGVEGFNVAIGGGMGRTDNAAEHLSAPRRCHRFHARRTGCSRRLDAVIGVQRDYGNRKDRARARFKYTIDDKGLDFIISEIEGEWAAPFEPARAVRIHVKRRPLRLAGDRSAAR